MGTFKKHLGNASKKLSSLQLHFKQFFFTRVSSKAQIKQVTVFSTAC